MYLEILAYAPLLPIHLGEYFSIVFFFTLLLVNAFNY